MFRLFRRERGAQGSGELGVVEESALWTTYQRAAQAVKESGEGAQRLAAHVAKQRSIVDGLADRARGASSRTNDLSASFTRLQEGFARLELVALNAGLEGARFGEGPGQALGLVAEEVKAQSSRGSQACRDLASSLGEVASELGHVHASLERIREGSAEAAQETARLGASSADAERALTEMADRLKSNTGTDPETARALADATEHARLLIASLATVTAKAPRAVVVAALAPILEPLFRILRDPDEP
jgi:ABC-type transporter Mla subunit MlaD